MVKWFRKPKECQKKTIEAKDEGKGKVPKGKTVLCFLDRETIETSEVLNWDRRISEVFVTGIKSVKFFV